MPLEGRIEDTNLLEVLQIIAFAGRTGSLTIESPRASGTVLFVGGSVRCALSSSTLPLMSALSKRPATDYPGLLLQDGIRTTLHELSALRRGEFSFSVSSALPPEYAGVDLTKFVETEGIDSRELFLALAREFDQARRRVIAILGSTDPASELPGGDPATELPSGDSPSEPPAALDDIHETVTDPSRAQAKALTRVLSRIATRYVERCIVFLVDGSSVRGLSTVGRDGPMELRKSREIEFERDAIPSFVQAIQLRQPESRHLHDDATALHVRAGQARDYALFPLVYHHEVLAILLCDNDASGEALSNTEGLAVFVEQAGMAMEKATLERRLAAMERPLSLANQGPLVQVAVTEG